MRFVYKYTVAIPANDLPISHGLKAPILVRYAPKNKNHLRFLARLFQDCSVLAAGLSLRVLVFPEAVACASRIAPLLKQKSM